ncbi:hypothetical protein XENOCAPTIV_005220, partial [Xenoophorus captivus]
TQISGWRTRMRVQEGGNGGRGRVQAAGGSARHTPAASYPGDVVRATDAPETSSTQ